MRQVHMSLNSGMEDLNVAFRFRIDGFDYVMFASSETMKCFRCGEEGHIRHSCPEWTEDRNAETAGSREGEDTVREDGCEPAESVSFG